MLFWLFRNIIGKLVWFEWPDFYAKECYRTIFFKLNSIVRRVCPNPRFNPNSKTNRRTKDRRPKTFSGRFESRVGTNRFAVRPKRNDVPRRQCLAAQMFCPFRDPPHHSSIIVEVGYEYYIIIIYYFISLSCCARRCVRCGLESRWTAKKKINA